MMTRRVLIGSALAVAAGGVAAALLWQDEPTQAAARAGSTSAPTAAASGSAYGSTLRLALDAEPDLACAVDVQRRVALDVPGPGQPDPADAVALIDDRQLGVVDGAATDTARVVAFDADQRAVAIYSLTLRSDGWWPDTVDTCPTT